MAFIKYKRVGDGYEVTEKHVYYSPRYNRKLTIDEGFYSDGATWAIDIQKTDAWIIHDHICRYARWDDGTRIDNLTASTVLRDLLWRDGYYFRAWYWFWATYLIGGGAARDNGMWHF